MRPLDQDAIDAAWDEVTARFPLPTSSYERSRWVDKHRKDLRDAYARIVAESGAVAA